MARRTKPGRTRSPINPYEGHDIEPDEVDEVEGLHVTSDSHEQRPEDEGFGDDGDGPRRRGAVATDRPVHPVVDPSDFVDE